MAMLVRWNPAREVRAAQRDMDQLNHFIEEAFRAFNGGTANDTDARSREYTLALDVHETADAYTVVTALPGVRSEDIAIEVHDGVLSIAAEINADHNADDNTRTLLRERRYGKFSRRVRLPKDVNAAAVQAAYENGVLSLTLPRSEAAKPRQIPVNAAVR